PFKIEDTIFSLDFGDGTILDTTGLPVTHSYDSVASYLVILSITNIYGCSDYDTISITIVSNQILYIPNVFSPLANNPENQVVKVYGEILSEGFEFRIYNRWGELIFQSVSQQEGWNGKYQNSGVDMDIGVYTYVVKGKFLDGTEFKEAGTVTLIR
ncbi:MAG: hypothetical protein FVQ77_07735, partial [Cytophagales bacterium]|nr:hypothetical protein [Cytophagales bacterium]